MAAAFIKFEPFIEDVVWQRHALATDTFSVVLTLQKPAPNSQFLADVSEIPAGRGYTSGGHVAATVSASQTNGTFKLVLSSPAPWVGQGDGMAPFRYAVLYNATARLVVGAWDLGRTITLQDSDEFEHRLSAAGVFTIG
jgi:hypothetical protein